MPYGGTISQVAAGDQAMDAQTRAAYEHMLDRLVQQHAMARHEEGDQSKEAEQRRQFDLSLAERQAAAGQHMTESQREFDLQNKYRYDALKEAQRTRRENLLLNSRRNNEMSGDRELRTLLPGAQDAADQGAWASPDEFKANNPAVLAPYASSLVARSLRARDALKQLYHADLADADVLNRDQALQHMINMENQSSWNADKSPLDSSQRPPGVFWNRSNTPDPAAIKEWTAGRTELAAPIQAIRSDRGRIGRLVPNANGGYDAVAPSWMQSVPRPAVAPQVGAPATAPTAAPAAPVWQEGAVLQHNATGQRYRVVNGQLVPLVQAPPVATNQGRVLPVEPDDTLDENFAQ